LVNFLGKNGLKWQKMLNKMPQKWPITHFKIYKKMSDKIITKNVVQQNDLQFAKYDY